MPWSPVTLTGEHVELVPLDVEAHADALFEATPEGTFQYFLFWPEPWTREVFRAFLAASVGRDGWLPLAVIERATGRVVGSSSFLDIDEKNRCVEVGATWYTPSVRGTVVNPECKLLMLRHAIETMGCVRVTLKCDARNLHSQRAIAAIGATREGTLRRHRIQPNGFARDTVYYSVLPEDWNRVQNILRARLTSTTADRGFVVRPATEADVPHVLPLVRLICNQHESMDPERFTFRPNILELYERWLPERVRDPRSIFFVAEARGGEIVGSVVGTVEPEMPIYWTPESAWIHDVVVRPEWRKRGVGSALVKAAAKRCAEIGVSRIRLETADANDAARAMFASCGFRRSTTEMMMTLRAPERRSNA